MNHAQNVSQLVTVGDFVNLGNVSDQTRANLSTCVQNSTESTASPPVKSKINGNQSHNDTKFKLPTPIHVSPLSEILLGYDVSLTEFLINGFTNGFSIDYVGQRTHRLARNHTSALTNKHIVQQKLNG